MAASPRAAWQRVGGGGTPSWRSRAPAAPTPRRLQTEGSCAAPGAVLSAGFPPCTRVSMCVTFTIASSYIIYGKDNIKVILKNKTTLLTFIKFAGASHLHLCKLQYYPQGSDLHVTLGRWNILFIPPRL